MLHSHTLYIDCLCFDVLVHNLTSSKTTVDLNEAKGMLLFKSVLAELEQSGGGGRKFGQKWLDELLRDFAGLITHRGRKVDMYFLHL